MPLWVQTPSKALPLLACWRRTPNRCPFGHCWMRDHHSLRSHAPGRIGGVAGQPRERARWAFRWLSRLNEVIAKGLATQLIGQTQYLRQQVERMR